VTAQLKEQAALTQEVITKIEIKKLRTKAS
jgi:hypothetical protein